MQRCSTGLPVESGKELAQSSAQSRSGCMVDGAPSFAAQGSVPLVKEEKMGKAACQIAPSPPASATTSSTVSPSPVSDFLHGRNEGLPSTPSVPSSSERERTKVLAGVTCYNEEAAGHAPTFDDCQSVTRSPRTGSFRGSHLVPPLGPAGSSPTSVAIESPCAEQGTCSSPAVRQANCSGTPSPSGAQALSPQTGTSATQCSAGNLASPTQHHSLNRFSLRLRRSSKTDSVAPPSTPNGKSSPDSEADVSARGSLLRGAIKAMNRFTASPARSRGRSGDAHGARSSLPFDPEPSTELSRFSLNQIIAPSEHNHDQRRLSRVSVDTDNSFFTACDSTTGAVLPSGRRYSSCSQPAYCDNERCTTISGANVPRRRSLASNILPDEDSSALQIKRNLPHAQQEICKTPPTFPRYKEGRANARREGSLSFRRSKRSGDKQASRGRILSVSAREPSHGQDEKAISEKVLADFFLDSSLGAGGGHKEDLVKPDQSAPGATRNHRGSNRLASPSVQQRRLDGFHRFKFRHFFAKKFGAHGSSAKAMGNSLGNCCAGRDDTSKEKGRDVAALWGFLEGGQQTDVQRFDEAFSNNDIQGLVNLLDSNEPIADLPDRMHPWAADPRSVGVLAATQLAILASTDSKSGDNKNKIRQAGAIPKLVQFLQSKEEDKVHAATIALSFLAVDNVQNCLDMYNAQGLRYLIKGMASPIEGMRGASAQACRNLFVLGKEQREAFSQFGGVKLLVDLLDLPDGAASEEQFNQVEAIYHIEDLILDGGEEIPELVSEVKRAGAGRKLDVLVEKGNSDVAEAARFLRVRLTD